MCVCVYLCMCGIGPMCQVSVQALCIQEKRTKCSYCPQSFTRKEAIKLSSESDLNSLTRKTPLYICKLNFANPNALNTKINKAVIS